MKKYSILLLLVSFFSVAQGQSLYFPPVSGNTWDTLSPASLNWCQSKIDSLYSYLDSNNTKAFILLKDGKIVLEQYFGTHAQNSLWQWASAGKTITAFMVGIAQQENHLSIHDTTSQYLGVGWTACTPAQEEKITIKHQLSMTSGLNDAVSDPYCTIDTCLEYLADAGQRWAYHNGPYTLLDGVIENATGTSLNAYTTQKLKNPTGMTGAFVQVGYNNVYFSNARSMARFGLLILNKGNWDGNQIMTDSTYFEQMVNSSQSLNPSYGYLWWLNGKPTYMVPGLQFSFNGPLCPNAPADMVAAMGKDGQLLNVVPSENMVWIRMGNSPDGVPVPFLMNDQIWQYINAMDCNASGLVENTEAEVVSIFPNPSQRLVQIKSSVKISKMHVYNIHGREIYEVHEPNAEMIVNMEDWPVGVYIISAKLEDGRLWNGKMVKQ